MRRDTRKHKEENSNKNILYIGESILGIGIIVFAITFVVYGNKMENQADIGTGKITALVQESSGNTLVTSTQMGKTVEESKNEITQESTNTNNNTNTVNTESTKKEKNTTTKQSRNTVETNTNKIKETETKQTNTNTVSEENIVKETQEVVTFVKPVEGEIVKNYAKDNLLYSETLQEWTTHLGLDIKADKTTVVKASANGKIKSIKNDPRYGLSIIIEHQDGYETLYANLLSTEFVQVGEEVKQGQSIGTVGNTATFEIADDAHLHFEISKNGENLDPNGFIK